MNARQTHQSLSKNARNALKHYSGTNPAILPHEIHQELRRARLIRLSLGEWYLTRKGVSVYSYEGTNTWSETTPEIVWHAWLYNVEGLNATATPFRTRIGYMVPDYFLKSWGRHVA